METQCQHLIITQRNEFLKLLYKLEELFDGTLGTWKTYPVDFKLKEEVNLTCSRPYPVPKVHEEIFKKEIEHLVLPGVLELANDSEWVAPSLAKKNLNQVEYFY